MYSHAVSMDSRAVSMDSKCSEYELLCGEYVLPCAEYVLLCSEYWFSSGEYVLSCSDPHRNGDHPGSETMEYHYHECLPVDSNICLYLTICNKVLAVHMQKSN